MKNRILNSCAVACAVACSALVAVVMVSRPANAAPAVVAWPTSGDDAPYAGALLDVQGTVNSNLSPQVDSAAVTTNTLYTPRYAGDLLLGTKVSGAGAVVWYSTGTTTTSWGLVSMAPLTDSAVTTTQTLYHPRYVGDMLCGFSNSLGKAWVATGTATSDWKAVLNP